MMKALSFGKLDYFVHEFLNELKNDGDWDRKGKEKRKNSRRAKL